MGMLARYQKSGGFLQLLHLIETCGPTKQERFLSIIQEEDSRWADTIKQKMLSMDKIMSWDESVLAEVAGRLNELTFAVSLHGLSEENWEKMSARLSHSQKRRIEDLKNEKNPTASEISASYVQILEEVRSMITHGYIRIDKIDPQMAIDEDIEEKIMSQFGSVASSGLSSEPEAGGENLSFGKFDDESKSGPSNAAELTSLKRQCSQLTQENNKLKNQLKAFQTKLDQIKKMAS